MQAEDVARTIAASCHPATSWLAGDVLHLDGAGKSFAEVTVKEPHQMPDYFRRHRW